MMVKTRRAGGKCVVMPPASAPSLVNSSMIL
jgi:hypothetical protein